MTYTTFWVEHKLWGFDPTGYHVVNVLLHLANTLLVWHILRRLAVPGAWLASAVFAVHPVHVESVAWVMERKDVLSGLFYLAAALAWLRFAEKPHPRYYIGSLALYAAGLLSKSIVVTLPVALLIVSWWQQGRITLDNLVRLMPFGLVGLIIVLGDWSFYQSRAVMSFDYSLTGRTLIAARALCFYAGKLLWPVGLTPFYPHWDIRPENLLAWGYLIAVVALVTALWHYCPRIGRGPLAGTLFFAVTLWPILGFVDYGYMKYSFVADRFQYLAGIGVIVVVCGAAAYGMGRLPAFWQKGTQVIKAAVVVALGVLTWHQQRAWQDKESLWRHVIAHHPQAPDAHFNLGVALYDQGRYKEALPIARIAVEQAANDTQGRLHLGAILCQLGQYEEAEGYFRYLIEHNPTPEAYLNLSVALHEQDRHEEALDAVRFVLKQAPDNAQAHSNLSAILGELGRYEEALDTLSKLATLTWDTTPTAAIKLRLRMAPDALFEVGMKRIEQERYDEALQLFQVLVNADSTDAVAHVNKGVALFHLGRSDEALQCFNRALALDSTLEGARANRKALLATMKENRNE